MEGEWAGEAEKRRGAYLGRFLVEGEGCTIRHSCTILARDILCSVTAVSKGVENWSYIENNSVISRKAKS